MKKTLNSILNLFIFLFFLLIFVNLISTISLVLYDKNCNTDSQCVINNTNLNYKKYGTHGSPILLIHGFFDSSKNFDSLAKSLSNDHIVICIDLLGCGLSDKSITLDYSKNNQAKICNDLMNTLGYKNYSVLGHSDGTDISLKLALMYPTNLDKLILLNEHDKNSINNLYAPMTLIKYLNLNYESQIIKNLSDISNKNDFDLNLLEYNLKNNLSLPTETYTALLKSRNEAINFDELKNIKAETLILWSSSYKRSFIDEAHKLSNSIPKSFLSIIENCGFYPQTEATSLIHKEASNFLNS